MDDDLIIAGKEIMVPRGSAWADKQSPREQLYVVLKGDTLWNISRKFKVSIEDLVLWNELNLEKPLQINQEIKIFSRYERIRQDLPSRELRTMLYPVKSGDTISRIASKFEISPQKIQEWNEIEDVSKIFPSSIEVISLRISRSRVDSIPKPSPIKFNENRVKEKARKEKLSHQYSSIETAPSLISKPKNLEVAVHLNLKA